MARLIIVGAGVAGAIAYKATSSSNPEVFEAGPSRACLDAHKAVMRIRDPRTALLLGVQTRKVTIHKQALWKEELVDSTSIEMNNLYSLKVSGELAPKSILHLGMDERLLLDGDILPPPTTRFNHTLVKVETGGANIARFKNPEGFFNVPYDYMISTIPLPSLLKILGIKHDLEFKSSSIAVQTAIVGPPSFVNQTIYFPEPEFDTYRATIEGQKFLMECFQHPTPQEISQVIKLFGLNPSDIHSMVNGAQNAGKMSRIPEADRRALLFRLTNEFNILSFGRFAIWKPIRTDEMTSDIEKVLRIIASRDAYQTQKEEAQ